MNNRRPFYISPFQSDLLDLSRWVAALLVVVEHLRSLMFANYGLHDHPGIAAKFFYFVTGFGHSAVMIFFVMSGFLVGGKVLDRLAQGNFGWQKYAVDRISRLYAVYVVALLLGGTLDWLGCHYFNQPGFYNQTFSGRIAVINYNFQHNLSLAGFGINLAMCQTILGPVFGSNGPLWSLANESWYYLAGPLFFALAFQKSIVRQIFGIIGLAVIIWFLPAPILIYALVWLLGAALYFCNGRRLLPLWVSLLLFTGSFCLARLQWLTIPYLPDFLIGIAFAMVINSAAGFSRRIYGHKWSKQAAGFSYSVYLCHFPFLVFTVAVLFQKGWLGVHGQPVLKTAGIYLLLLGLAYLWCFLISLATERQTPRIRAWFGQRSVRQPG